MNWHVRCTVTLWMNWDVFLSWTLVVIFTQNYFILSFRYHIFDRFKIGSASLARSIRIRFHFRHRTGRIRSVSDHRAGRVWRSRHRSKTPNCLPGARDQVPALFRNAIERRGASVDSNSGAPITQSTFNMLRRMANLLSLLNWWLHRYDNEDDYALFQV